MRKPARGYKPDERASEAGIAGLELRRFWEESVRRHGKSSELRRTIVHADVVEDRDGKREEPVVHKETDNGG